MTRLQAIIYAIRATRLHYKTLNILKKNSRKIAFKIGVSHAEMLSFIDEYRKNPVGKEEQILKILKKIDR